MNTTVSPELLYDYFAGRVTALQRQTIAEWLRDPANEETFYHCLDEWERRKPQYIADPTDALPTYRAFLQQTHAPPAAPAQETTPTPTPVLQVARRAWLSLGTLLAASVTLLLLAGGWLLRDQLRYRTIQTAYGETRSIWLDDGSTVVLNANSSLRVPRFGFGRALWGPRSRQVQLVGEAAFAVTHTPDDQRFVVHTTKGLDVVVLGTEFTVFSRPRETKVVLAKGKVLVNYPAAQQTKQLTLRPGDVVALDSGGQLKRATTRKPRDFAAWQRHEYIFSNTSLREVSQLLHENYGLTVRIVGNDLPKQTLTGSFHAENVDELLQAISDVMGINVVRHDQQVVLNDNNA